MHSQMKSFRRRHRRLIGWMVKWALIGQAVESVIIRRMGGWLRRGTTSHVFKLLDNFTTGVGHHFPCAEGADEFYDWGGRALGTC